MWPYGKQLNPFSGPGEDMSFFIPSRFELSVGAREGIQGKNTKQRRKTAHTALRLSLQDVAETLRIQASAELNRQQKKCFNSGKHLWGYYHLFVLSILPAELRLLLWMRWQRKSLEFKMIRRGAEIAQGLWEIPTHWDAEPRRGAWNIWAGW